MKLLLGNRDAFNLVDGNPVPVSGNFRLDIHFPDDTDLLTAFTNVTSPQGIWAAQTATADSVPAWCASDSSGLAELIAEHFGCEIRELDELSDGAPVLGGTS